MKFHITLPFFLFIFTVGMSAQPLEQAEHLYKRGDYREALSKYQEIKNPSRALLYAMGACSYHLENYPQAMAYWRKAERGAGLHLHAAIDVGITNIYEKVGKNYYVSWPERIKRVFTMIPLLLIQIVVMLGFASQFLFVSYFAPRRWLKIGTRVAIILGFLLMYQFDEQQYAIIRRTAPVYGGPGQDYPVVGELSLLDQVTIEDKEDTWYKIKHSEIKGWIEHQSIELV